MNYKLYCKNYQDIENYEPAKKDNFKGWCCHHRLETHTSDGERRLVDITAKELIALHMYYNRPSEELIFMKANKHSRLHNKGKKRMPFSEEWKKNMSEGNKGKHLSEEHKKRISEALREKPKSEETKKKISEAQKGRIFSEEHKRKLSNAKKGKHFSEETKKKMAEHRKGKHWKVIDGKRIWY